MKVNECDSLLTLYEIHEVAKRENSTIKIFSIPLFGALAGVGAGDRDLARVLGSGGGSIPESLFVRVLF